jgi:metal-responsive CopG/Arc/MetJ family transcriptional regulator
MGVLKTKKGDFMKRMKRICVELDHELYKKFRKLIIDDDTKMATIIRYWIRKYVELNY